MGNYCCDKALVAKTNLKKSFFQDHGFHFGVLRGSFLLTIASIVCKNKPEILSASKREPRASSPRNYKTLFNAMQCNAMQCNAKLTNQIFSIEILSRAMLSNALLTKAMHC